VNDKRVRQSPAQIAAALEGRILAAVARESAPTRGELRARTRWLGAAAAAGAAAVFAWAGGLRAAPRPVLLIIATSLGTAALAALAFALAVSPGRGRMSRPRLELLAAVAVIPAALLLWKVCASSVFDGMTAAWPDRPGLRCLYLTLAAGAWPLAAALLSFRGSDPVHPFSTGAALGAAAGLAAAVLVDLWCPVAYPPHLTLGHLLPIAVLAALGALGGFRLRPRIGR
jgi:hypothetical protein